MTKKSLIKLFIIITFSLILFYFILGKISGFEAYIKNDFDKYISVEITKPDGTVNYYDSNEFPLVNKGDIVYATVNLPRERYVKNSILCFHSYHSIVNVYDSNGNLLYDNKDKRVQEDEMIGGTSVFVHIPEEDWGKTYTIRLDVQKNHAFSKIQEVVVIDSVYAYKYLIGDKQAEIMLFMAILVISIMILFVLIFNGAWNSIKRQGIFLLSFLSLVSLWLLGHNNVLDLLSDNTVFNINLKYIALFSSPVMLSLFFYEQNKRKSSKRMHLAFALMYGVFVLICILLNYTTVNYHYFKMLAPFRILLVLGVIAELFITIRCKKTDDLSIEALRYGGIIFLVMTFLELIKYYIYIHANYHIEELTQNFTSIELIILIVSIVLSYAVQLADHYISEYEKSKLERMAYYDALTGIANRAGCYRCFENLDYTKDNALIFVDVNNLKYANDVFGHGMGDSLIKFIAEALEVTFENYGFYGRFGGDEFIAVISFDKIEKVYNYMNTFNEILSEANEKNLFPFEVSASYGISISSKENPIPVGQLIKNADKKMYTNKKKQKAARK